MSFSQKSEAPAKPPRRLSDSEADALLKVDPHALLTGTGRAIAHRLDRGTPSERVRVVVEVALGQLPVVAQSALEACMPHLVEGAGAGGVGRFLVLRGAIRARVFDKVPQQTLDGLWESLSATIRVHIAEAVWPLQVGMDANEGGTREARARAFSQRVLRNQDIAPRPPSGEVLDFHP